MTRLTRALSALTALLLLAPAFAGAEDESALFTEALAALKTPAAEALATGAYTLRTGDTAYVPTVAPPITPFDQLPAQLPPVSGTFESSDPAAVVLAWHRALGVLPLPKSGNRERQLANLATSLVLSDDAVTQISALARPDGRTAGQDPRTWEEF